MVRCSRLILEASKLPHCPGQTHMCPQLAIPQQDQLMVLRLWSLVHYLNCYLDQMSRIAQYSQIFSFPKSELANYLSQLLSKQSGIPQHWKLDWQSPLYQCFCKLSQQPPQMEGQSKYQNFAEQSQISFTGSQVSHFSLEDSCLSIVAFIKSFEFNPSSPNFLALIVLSRQMQ